MAKTFEELLNDLSDNQKDLLKERTLSWYLDQIKKLGESSQNSSENSAPNSSPSRYDPQQSIRPAIAQFSTSFDTTLFGRMLLYRYDPKGKKTLPYYDTYPLVIPLVPTLSQKVSNSFLGLNLHYLPPPHRAKFFDALSRNINNPDKLDDKSRIQITYKLLKNASKYRYYKPCIKRYLFDHIKTRISIIKPSEWNRVMLMPLARFQKESEFKVWVDSIRKARS